MCVSSAQISLLWVQITLKAQITILYTQIFILLSQIGFWWAHISILCTHVLLSCGHKILQTWYILCPQNTYLRTRNFDLCSQMANFM